MPRRFLLILLVTVLAGLFPVLGADRAIADPQQPALRPNILLIFTDDAGYNDFSFQGSKQYTTPQIDRLAAEGVVCENGYVSAAVCGPSRAGLLTGRYQQRFGYFMNPKPGQALPLSETTFGDALKAKGYRTGLIGKWHMGNAPQYQPNRRGFDYFYGFLAGHRSYFPYKNPNHKKGRNPTFRLMHNDKLLDETDMDFYTTDLFTDKAIAFMDESRAAGQPFFLFFSHLAVHGPMEALKEDAAPYQGLENAKRRKLGGMTAALDRSTGRLLDWLDQTGLRGDTLVVFVNDNGGGRYIAANNWPLRGYKGEEWEGGIRVPFIVSWPGRLPEGARFEHPVISLDLFPTFLTLAGGAEDELNRLDGVDLTPYLAGEKAGPPHEALFWQRNNAAVRVGDWKLIERNTAGGAFELYNLARDVGEKNNVIEQYPDIAEDLKARLKAWQAQNAERM